jgi:hypothetical protein
MTAERFIPLEPDDAANPEPTGGGFAVALLGGFAASGAVLLLVVAAPLAIAWLGVATILAGAAVQRAANIVTVTAAAAALPLITPLFATCLTGYWGFFIPVLLALGVSLAVVTPAGFAVGRLLRPRLVRAYTLMRALLAIGGLLSLAGWAFLIADAINPGTCPPAP